MSDSPNYCQHPECHNSHISWYADRWGTGTFASPPRPEGHWISWLPMPAPWRRWCRAHALLNEGASFG